MPPASITLHGVTASTDGLIKTDNLQVQLAMILEVVSDLAAKSRQIDESISQLQQKQGQQQIEMRAMRKDVDRMDDTMLKMETTLTKRINGLEKDLQTACEEHEQLKARVDEHQPRIERLETRVQENDVRFTKALTRHEADIDLLQTEQKKQGSGLSDLKARFEAADIDGLRDKVMKIHSVLEGHTEKLEGHQKSLDGLGKKLGDLEENVNGIVPFCKSTFATIKTVEQIQARLAQFATKTYMDEKQQEFHEHIQTFVEEELQEDRMEIYDKMGVLEERILRELEAATQANEVQYCTDRIQTLTKELQDLGASVTKHDEEIERSASRILQMTGKMESVSALRDSMDEMRERFGGMMANLQVHASRVQVPSSDDAGGDALNGLQGAIADTVRQLSKQVQHDLVPRPFLEDALLQLRRRFADLEWKITRRREPLMDATSDDAARDR